VSTRVKTQKKPRKRNRAKQGALGAETKSRYTDRCYSVHSAVQPPLNAKIKRKLAQNGGRLKLCDTTKDTITVASGGRLDCEVFAVARDVKTAYPGERVLRLEDILFLDAPPVAMVDVTLIIPNTERHRLVSKFVGTPEVGAFDWCRFPDCTACPRSAQCITDGVCYAVVCQGRLHRDLQGSFAVGDKCNTLTVGAGTPTPLYQQPALVGAAREPYFSMESVQIFLKSGGNSRQDSFKIEMTKEVS